jgi:uncharacterized protein (DUF362 family)
MNASPAPPGRAVVALEPVRGDVRAAIRRCLDAVEWKRVIPAGSAVALKVNLGWDLFIPGSITSPLFAEALILELRDHVGKLYMVEADQVLEDIEAAFHKSGMAEVCRRTGVEWVNMSRGEGVTVQAPENAVLKQITVPRILREALLVTVPVMKTHAKTGITGSLKNQWGCLPKMRHEYHLVLDDALADLNTVMRPVLAVMDGTVGLEGNGPKSGRPRISDRVLCSTDPVALDTIQAICMGVDPATVRHLATCAARGIGTCDRSRIEVRGLSPEDGQARFLPARHNAVSLVETLLRRSALKKLFFNTPIFGLCLTGAKLYYRAWYASQAERHWRTVREHPLYGPQWRPGWEGLSPESKERASPAPGSPTMPVAEAGR